MFLERRLRAVNRRLAQVRADLSVADEQLLHFNEESDDARLRSLVSETPLAGVEHREAERHSAAMARHRAELVELVARLEAEQDSLLDKMTARRRSSGA
jgi:hypothetical protein